MHGIQKRRLVLPAPQGMAEESRTCANCGPCRSSSRWFASRHTDWRLLIVVGRRDSGEGSRLFVCHCALPSLSEPEFSAHLAPL